MRTSYIVAGLAYGDEGKGATVDFLVRQYEAKLVVRYNGGSQAGHNVVLSDGRSHTFSQFGSGTFVPEVLTHLSRFMLVNPLNMMNEEKHLCGLGVSDAFDRLSVEDKALIITPFHVNANRKLEESRGSSRHGSCGQGIGECREQHLKHGEHVLFAGDLVSESITKEKLRFIQNIYGNQDETIVDDLWKDYREWPANIVKPTHLDGLLKKYDSVFEGAQGVLLDENYGTAPHNTWTDCTFKNALELLDGYDGERIKIGVVRTYYTRHGEGPFPTEDYLDFSERHNTDDGFQGKFRLGHFDQTAFNYALEVCNGVDCIALNHLDLCADPGIELPTLIRGYGARAEDREILVSEEQRHGL